MSTTPASPDHTRGRAIAQYAAGALARAYPPEVLDAARRAMVDFVGVAVGAWDDAPVRPVRGMEIGRAHV